MQHNTKFAELIEKNPRILLLLPRFGIGLGFGDHSVSEVCSQYHISPDFFLLVCKVYSDNDYFPDAADLKSVDSNDLIAYLTTSHHYYLNTQLPHIESHLDEVVKACQPKYGLLLKRFFQEYQQEVVKHFEYEEHIVFPYIHSVIDNNPIKDYRIMMFKHNHSNIEDKLSDLLNILLKYLPAEIEPQSRIDISLDIIELSADLNSHSLIEERVLIPYVEMLEGGES